MMLSKIRSGLVVGLLGVMLVVTTVAVRQSSAAEHAEAADATVRTNNFFIALKPLSVPVRRRNKIERYIALQVSLEMVDDEARLRARHLLPRVRDIFIRELFANPAIQHPSQGRIDYRRIRSLLLHRARQILGSAAVITIYITGT